MNLSKFFIDRPIFAGVLSVLIFVAGLLALRAMPISEYPEVVPPSVVVRAQLSGRQPEGDRRDGGDADRGADQRRRRHALHEQPGDDRRPDDADRHVQARHRSRQGAAAGAEPRLAGRAAPARGGAPARHHHGQELARPDHGRAPALAEQPLRHDLSAQLRAAQRQGPPGAHRRRRRRCSCSAPATIRCASGSTRRRSPSAASRRATSSREIQAQNVQAAAGVVGASPEPAGHRPAALGQRAGPPAERGGVRRHRRQDRRRTARSRGCATSPASSSARREYSLRSLLDNKPAVAIGIFQAPGSNALAISDNVRAHDGRAEEEHAGGRRLPDRLRPDPVRARLDRGRGAHAARGGRAGRAGGDPVPADLARLDHPAAGGAGLDHRHVRGDVRVRLLDQRAQPVRPGAGDRHRGRRRDRRGRERRAQHRERAVAARGDLSARCARCPGRSSRSRWCWSRCSCRSPSSAA